MARKTVLFVADEDNLNEQFICDGDVSLDNCYQKSMEGVIKYEKLEGYDDSLTVKNGVLVNGKGEILSHREDDYISVGAMLYVCSEVRYRLPRGYGFRMVCWRDILR